MDAFSLLVGSNGDEFPVEIEKETKEWKVYFTLKEIGRRVDLHPIDIVSTLQTTIN